MLGNKMLYMLITNMKELMYDVTTINVALSRESSVFLSFHFERAIPFSNII